MKNLRFDHFVLFVVALLVAGTIYLSWRSPVARAIRHHQPIDAVLIGTDLVDNARHADTLMFIDYVPETRFLSLISIPRDTHFSPEGFHFQRINEIFAYHYRKQKNEHTACAEVKAGVEQLLQNRVHIPYYVQIDYASFRRFIDLIGGVTIDIDEPMHYDDAAGGLHIHFDPGSHHLNGQQALEYVRFRGKAGDIGRVFRQQRFVRAVLNRFHNPLLLARLPQIVHEIGRNIHTNLSPWDMLNAALEVKDLHAQDLRLAQLPGTPYRDYWQVDVDSTAGLLDKVLPSTGTVTATGQRIRVEVLNASGKNKLADRVSWILRKHGYDVVYYGTLAIQQRKTLIKDLTGDLGAAQRVVDIISCGEVVTRYEARRLFDISVTLGEDCTIADTKKK